MNTQLAKSIRQTIGVDLGDKRSHICVLDTEGQVASECTITTGPSAFRKYFVAIPSALVVIEVGPHSRWETLWLPAWDTRCWLPMPGECH
jgi:hypothetical protein